MNEASTEINGQSSVKSLLDLPAFQEMKEKKAEAMNKGEETICLSISGTISSPPEIDRQQEESVRLAGLEIKARRKVEQLRVDLIKAEQEHRAVSSKQAIVAARLTEIYQAQAGVSAVTKRKRNKK